MNKKQKQLIKTYFRKRRIADKEGINYTTPELIFMLENNMGVEWSGDAVWVSNNIKRVLVKQPQLVDKLPIEKMVGGEIFWVLEKQPQLVDKLPVEKMSGNGILRLLHYQPQLKPYFKERGLI